MTDRQQIVELDFLRGLIAAVDDSGIDSLEVSRGGTRIRISKSAPAVVVSGASVQPGPVPAPPREALPPTAPPAPSGGGAGEAAPAAASNLVEIKSPMVGTFYRSPAPEAPSYVEVGTRVSKGQTLCILEAMKLMNELEAEVSGTIKEILAESSEPVEYGQVLFRIEPEA
ncbi:acetyl-CoA carboxylase biotin carboxyl carrier protein [soil metagenome]